MLSSDSVIQKTARPFPQREIYSAHSGQSITEYSLAGALVIVVSIGALTLLGDNLNGVLNNLSGKASDQSLVSVKPKLLSAPPVNGATVLNASPIDIATKATTAVQGASAPAAVTQTVGVNGGTEKYSQDILTAAKQGLADGSITQTQYDIYMQMANTGHQMAAMEGLLTQAYQQSKDDSEYQGKQVTYNGRTYTTLELSSLLDTTAKEMDALWTSPKLNQQTKSFETVTMATNQIQYIKDLNINANLHTGTISLSEMYSSNSSASNTNQQSATICTVGQHLDTNNHCVN